MGAVRPITIERAECVARDVLGLPGLRPLQAEIIAAVLAGHDVLGVLPTGGGKSLCYQLPTMLQPGLTLVVSPLLSLMKDQVESELLQRAGLGEQVCAINSQLDPAAARDVLYDLRQGHYRLVFAAPERLRSRSFRSALAARRVSLLAIDEAHCVSQWGHDFRPDYRQLAALRQELGSPPVLALTATATPTVQTDVLEQLGIPQAQRFVASCDRPNLFLAVHLCRGQAEQRQKVTGLLRQVSGSAIVYVDRRRDAEQWAVQLSAALFEPLYCYHAGMTARERTQVQEAFMAGYVRAVVATNAFGMGIDKPDIRLVVHAGLPGSMEAYYQEIGRAGRDGNEAQCHLVLGGQRELQFRRWLIDQTELSRAEIKSALAPLLRAKGGDDVHVRQAHAAAWSFVAAELQTRRWVEVSQQPSGQQLVRLLTTLDRELIDEMVWLAERQQRQKQQRLKEMERYVRYKGCRRQLLLHYFGQEREVHQTHCCDWCQRAGRGVKTR